MITKQKSKHFLNKLKGATMVEYAIMVGLIAVVSVAIITGLGQQASTIFSTVNSTMVDANG